MWAVSAVPNISGSHLPIRGPPLGGDRELVMVEEFVGKLLGERGGEEGRRWLCLQERKDSDTWVRLMRCHLLFRALGRLLKDIHVTWDHLEKKQTRFKLYTKVVSRMPVQCLEMASQSPSDAVRSYKRQRQKSYDGVKI
uniref:Uncharacterized protein n=1 Tax=Tanacetum cinerariifolium TaxID=118510 RepID=A0A6L2J7R8_TANCI|nr:hypothetical protein [Tanacetum cinerariifolium]